MSGGQARYVPWLIAIAIGILFVWRTFYIDFVIFAGILLAIFLRRLSEALSWRARMRESWALAVTIIAIAFLVILAVYFFADTVFSQVGQLASRLSAAWTGVERHLEALPWGNAVLASLRSPGFNRSRLLNGLFGVASNTFTLLGGIVAVIFFGIYIAAEPNLYRRGILTLFPERLQPRLDRALSRAGDTLWYWTLGRLFSMSVVAAGTMASLAVLGIPLPIVLGGLAGLLTFVPYLGSIAAAIPALVFALSISVQKTIYVLVLYTLVHVIEGYILVPFVQRRAAHLPPAVILSSQLILGALVGVIGVTFATPLAAAILAIVSGMLVDRDHGA